MRLSKSEPGEEREGQGKAGGDKFKEMKVASQDAVCATDRGCVLSGR